LLPLFFLGQLIDLVGAASSTESTGDSGKMAQSGAIAEPASDDGVLSPNSAPVLSYSIPLTLSDITEDTPQEGDLLVNILEPTELGDPITDADKSAKEGVAVFGADNSNGVWEYKIPGSPSIWQPFGVVTDTGAVLLGDTSRIRFVPSPNYFGSSISLDIRAWDQTSGVSGDRVDITINGGTTAFSVDESKITVRVWAVNDAPVLGGYPTDPLTYTEDVDLPLWPELTVTDADSQLASAEVKLINQPDGDAEKLLATTGDTGLIASYEAGVLHLTGTAAPEVYQQVLRTVVYRNILQDPNPVGDRRIQLSVTEHQGSETPPIEIVVQVFPVNDPPQLDLDGIGPGVDFAATYLINRGPVPIVADSLQLTDVDDTKIYAAEIKVLNPGSKDGDVLRATDFEDDNISVVAYNIDTGILSLTGVDIVANYQRALRTLTYDNIHKEPDPRQRDIQFTLTDADGVLKSEPRYTILELEIAPLVFSYLPVVAPAYRWSEEPNNSCAQALGMINNTEYNFQADATEDWYFFDLMAPADVTVELNNFAEGQIIIYSAGCTQNDFIENNGDNNPTKLVPLDTLSAGRYYIRIIYDGEIAVAPAYRLVVWAAAVP
jgi:hypothetical protein